MTVMMTVSESSTSSQVKIIIIREFVSLTVYTSVHNPHRYVLVPCNDHEFRSIFFSSNSIAVKRIDPRNNTPSSTATSGELFCKTVSV